MGIKESTETENVIITDSVTSILNSDTKILKTFSKSGQGKDINNDHVTGKMHRLCSPPESETNIMTKIENKGKSSKPGRLDLLLEEEYCSLSSNNIKNNCD